jgi:MscS family membrane protein
MSSRRDTRPTTMSLLALPALALAGMLAVATPARAQGLGGLGKAPAAAPATPAPAPAATPEPEAEAPDSPRATARAFVELARKRDWEGAGRYLLVSPADEPRRAELARRLRAVLQRHLDIDFDTLSPLSEGSTQDGLPPGNELLGRVPGAGDLDPVYLVRTRDAKGPYWAFSRQTVSRIDAWYDALPDRWVRDVLPDPLQQMGPLDLLYWQWLALPLLVVVSLLLGRLLGGASAGVLRRVAARTASTWDDRLLERTAPALTLLWAMALAALLLPYLALLPPAHAFARSLIGGVATFAVFWAVWRSVDVWALFLMARPWAVENASARSLLSVARNLLKIVIGVAGFVTTLGWFGYPVATVLAGLGIGGIAIAFGAQKTIENLFGSISLAADQPFRVGDLVKIEDFTGNVERIGMRSTQIRTPDRTLITLPNGKLSDMRIEDFASRDRVRFAATVGLEYRTTEAQVRQVVEGIERMLRAMPRTWPDVVVARLAAFSPSSLDVEVLCWFVTTDFEEYRRLRQDALLGILRIVEEAGASIAFPTQTVLVAGADGRPLGPPPAPPQRAE